VGSETSTPASTYSSADPAGDDSFIRHQTYFFKDGNVTFLVRGVQPRHCQAEVTVKCKAEVEDVRRMMKVTMHKAGAEREAEEPADDR
jgi:hypothetical protein